MAPICLSRTLHLTVVPLHPWPRMHLQLSPSNSLDIQISLHSVDAVFHLHPMYTCMHNALHHVIASVLLWLALLGAVRDLCVLGHRRRRVTTCTKEWLSFAEHIPSHALWPEMPFAIKPLLSAEFQKTLETVPTVFI